ncbi:MAG: hypothetical protein EB168_05470 [Euryarchaeota archaeon]|nr:hypothetical protein [Euryarchaeota archaeon]
MSFNDLAMIPATVLGVVTLGIVAVLFTWVAVRVLLAVILVVPLGIACMIIDAHQTYKQNKQLTRKVATI